MDFGVILPPTAVAGFGEKGCAVTMEMIVCNLGRGAGFSDISLMRFLTT